MRIGSNVPFQDEIEKTSNGRMFFWCDGKDAGLHKRSLDNSTNLCFVGMPSFSGNFVNPVVVKEEIDRELENVNKNLVGNAGVRVGRVQK